MQFDERSLAILQYLREKGDFVNIRTLSEIFGVTDRTVRYDIDKIEKILVKNGFEYLERQYGKGIRLKGNRELDGFIDKFVNTSTPYRYNYSKEERQKIIILQLLQSNEPIQIADFEKMLYVSRNTVLNELDIVEKWLKERGLVLIRKPRVGLYIKGSEIKKRNTIMDIASKNITTEEMLNYMNNKIAVNKVNNFQFQTLFAEIDLDFLNGLINYAENSLDRKFSDEAYTNLITHISIMIKRIQLDKKIYIPNTNYEYIQNTEEYRISKEMVERIEKKFGIAVPKEEVEYIALHLLGAKSLESRDVEKDDLYNVVETMTSEIEDMYNVVFTNKEKVIEDLVVHLRPTIYRIKFGLKLYNPLYDNIVKNYKKLFDDTKLVLRHLEGYIGKEIGEHEISYVTLHFGAALKNSANREKAKPKVIVVCSTGIGTSKMIATQISERYDIEIVDTLSLRSLKNYSGDYDYIISTIDIPDLEPSEYVKVSSLMLKKDFDELEKHFNLIYAEPSKNDDTLVIKLMNIIDKYIRIEDRERLEYELLYEIKEHRKSILYERRTYMLKDLLKRDVIELNVECKDWKEAVRRGGQSLLAKGSIGESYIEAIFKSLEENGPYMVVGPGIVLAHARPEDGVNNLCMSLITLKEGINFGNETNDPVKLIITFGAVDNESHLKALSQLMELFMNSNDINKIISSTTKDDVLDIIHKYSN
jgi:transcriptional antiterminator/mannitol/fructose-specific phosphotransferase system IIA component (Ntr-type)